MPEKILIVDDDPTIIALVQAILKAAGYSTVIAVNGLEALRKVKEDRPALVVLDIEMPVVNGYDVCNQLRFSNEYENIPILILTSREREISEEMSRRENMDYMQKPVDTKLLTKKIKKILSK